MIKYVEFIVVGNRILLSGPASPEIPRMFPLPIELDLRKASAVGEHF
jgi:hypothetical protein